MKQQCIVAKSTAIATAAKPVRSPGTKTHRIARQLLQSVLKEAFGQRGKVYEMEEGGVLNMVAEE